MGFLSRMFGRRSERTGCDEPAQGVRRDLFVSYARGDFARVSEVMDWLFQHGLSRSSVFIDQGNIDGALEFPAVLEEAILNCKVLLFFVSRQSVESRWVKKEVFLADAKGKAVFPIFLEKVELPPGMNLQLASIQQIDLYVGKKEDRYRAILQSLQRLGIVGGEQAIEASAVEKVQPRTAGHESTATPASVQPAAAGLAEARYEVLAVEGQQLIVDRKTALMWAPLEGAFSWDAAKALGENVPVGGYDGWRLPTIAELRTLITRAAPPYLDARVFGMCSQGHVYSSLTTGGRGMFGTTAKAFSFENLSTSDFDIPLKVLLVREMKGRASSSPSSDAPSCTQDRIEDPLAIPASRRSQMGDVRLLQHGGSIPELSSRKAPRIGVPRVIADVTSPEERSPSQKETRSPSIGTLRVRETEE